LKGGALEVVFNILSVQGTTIAAKQLRF